MEAKIMEVLDHINIIKFIEVYTTKTNKFCIVMDYADGGDILVEIKKKIKKRKETGEMEYWSEDFVMNWFC